MSEKELRTAISCLFRRTDSIDAGMAAAAQLLSRELGEVQVLKPAMSPTQTAFIDPRVVAFLESRQFPFRGVYAASAGQDAHIVMLLGSWGFPKPSIQTIAEHLAQELSLLEKRHAAFAPRLEAA